MMATDPKTQSEAGADCKRTPWQVVVSRLIAERGVIVQRGLRFGNGDRHVYDLYEPPDGEKVRAVAQFIYGGSWETGERGCYAFIGAALAKRGVRTVIADYRLYPEAPYPGFVEDAARAYAHVCAHHLSDQAAPALVGHSAGAHIAALMAGDPRYLRTFAPRAPKPAALIGISGPYAFDPTTWETTKHIFTAVRDTPDVARPIAFASKAFPPTKLLHGARDTLVTPDASRKFHAALQAAGATSELRVYRLLAHAGPIIAMARPLNWFAAPLHDTLRFIEKHASPAPQPSFKIRTAESAPTA